MPRAFTDCVSGGGRVRTVKGKQFGMKSEGQYRHICINKSGKTFMGHVKTKK